MRDDRLVHEIEHGTRIAVHAEATWNWTSPAGRIRWNRRASILTSHVQPGMKVLEIGCGTGLLTDVLVQKQADVTALDVSQDLMTIAKQRLAARPIRFLINSAYQLSLATNAFDTIVGSSVLHHLDVIPALREFYRVLKPGGTLRFAEPNMLNPQIAIQKNIPAVKRMLGDCPDETAFIRWRLKAALEEMGFGSVRITPFDFLHPRTPAALIPTIRRLGQMAESLPGLSEIAGSLFIRAERP